MSGNAFVTKTTFRYGTCVCNWRKVQITIYIFQNMNFLVSKMFNVTLNWSTPFIISISSLIIAQGQAREMIRMRLTSGIEFVILSYSSI